MTKEYILGEIVRLTEANGGKPVGRAAFLRETGIKSYHWGKFWAIWGDAVREAGLVPNEFGSALDEEFVLQQLALLTKSFGHFPTQGEMRLEKIKNPAFPSDGAISRLGRKSEQVQALLAYCGEQDDLSDIANMLGEISLKEKPQEPKPEGDGNGDNSGYVYLIRSHDAYKIGCTKAPYRRAAEIANQSAHGAELIHLIPTDDPFGIEKYWHDRFDAKRVVPINKETGEWFALSADDIRAFKRRKSFM